MTEELEARRDNAVLQPNSGRGKYAKGDAILDNTFMIDYKEYTSGFAFNDKVWAKLCSDTMAVDFTLEPLFKLVLIGDKFKERVGICDWDTYASFRSNPIHLMVEAGKSFIVVAPVGLLKLKLSSGTTVAIENWDDMLKTLQPPSTTGQ